MQWQAITTIQLAKQWQFLEIHNSDFVRLVATNNYGQSPNNIGLIAQSLDNLQLSFFNAQQFRSGIETQVYQFYSSLSTTLGFKRLNDGQPWVIQIDKYDGGFMPLTNPIVTTYVNPVTSSTATNTTVAASATSVSALAANSNRKDATFNFKGSGGNCYLCYGATATVAGANVVLSANGYFELPMQYTGQMSAIFDAGATGNLIVTEFT